MELCRFIPVEVWDSSSGKLEQLELIGEWQEYSVEKFDIFRCIQRRKTKRKQSALSFPFFVVVPFLLFFPFFYFKMERKRDKNNNGKPYKCLLFSGVGFLYHKIEKSKRN